jgi:pyruvate ferredoxin oxidoreductase beta subunit
MSNKVPPSKIIPGHGTCPGCGGALAEQMIMKTVREKIGDDFIWYGRGVCASSGMRNFAHPKIHFHFNFMGSPAAGIAAALEMQGRTHIKVIEGEGDGAVSDIGFAKFSACAERNDNILLYCVDNEAYMNTGIQRSSQTPWMAWTTTTPFGKKVGRRKDLALVMAAHKIPYIATASIAYPEDLKDKFKRALDIEGYRFIHVQVPCPTGWRYPANKTIEVGRLSVQTGLWKLIEIENGLFKMTYKPKELRPITDYTKSQRRFRYLTSENIENLQQMTHIEYQEYMKKDRKHLFTI